MDLAFHAADDGQGLAKINLGVAGRMRQRNKHLPPALSDTADVVLHNGDLARKAVLITQPLEYPLRCVTLLLRTILILFQDTVDNTDNKRVVIGRYGKVTADQARRQAQKILGKVADGDDPAKERAEARSMPMLGDTFEEYMTANPNRSKLTNELYRYEAKRYLGDWLKRPIDAITRKDVETRFNGITADHGWSAANRAMSLLRSVYRRPCVDLDGLRNPVDLWLAGGGKFHRKKRRKISAPAEVLPCWRAGIEAEVHNPVIRGALWFGLYTGMRREEVLTLRWERVDLKALTFRVEETKTGVPLELPVTRQLAAILERRLAAADDYRPAFVTGCFPRPPAPPAMCRISIISTAASARPAAPSSGFTACGTASSPSPSAS